MSKGVKGDKSVKGNLIFEEIWKNIEYYLPVIKSHEPLFVMKKMEYTR